MNSIGIPIDSAVTSHMTSTSADATNDVCREVTLFWTIILAMTNTSTILANLILVITEGSVKSSELTQLVSLVIVLALGCGSSLRADQALELQSRNNELRKNLQFQ